MTKPDDSKSPKRKRRSPQEQEVSRRDFYRAVDAGDVSLRDGVRQFRRMLGMNQRDFAKYVGVPPRVLMAFEQGTGNPTLGTIQKMLKGSGLELKLGRKR